MFEDYDYYELSDADIAINEAVEKIKTIIKEQAKNELQETETKLKCCESSIDYLTKEVNKYQDANEVLRKENESLKNKEKNKSPQFKFNIGDTVYFTVPLAGGNITCPTCSGTGRITINDPIYGEVQAACPTCHGKYYGSTGQAVARGDYYNFIVNNKKITGQCFELEDDKICESYYLDDNIVLLPVDCIFSSFKDAQAYAEEQTKKSMEIAEAKVSGRYDYQKCQIIDKGE